MANKEQNESSQQPIETDAPELPPGVKLMHTLRGHTRWIGRIAWSLNGRILASPSGDYTIRLWDAKTGECLRMLDGLNRTDFSVAFDPTGRKLASGNSDSAIKLWEADSGRLLRTLGGHKGIVYSVAFDPAGRMLASGSGDNTVKLWEANSGRLLRTLGGHKGIVYSVAFDPAGCTLASGSNDSTIKLWEADSGRLLRTLEGHTGSVLSVALLFDGQFIASKAIDDTIRLWSSDTGACLSIIPEPSGKVWPSGLTSHPHLPLFATVGSDPGTPKDKRDCLIHIYELDLAVLFGQMPTIQTSHYVNAKAVLLGDTGVGKSGLSMVLNGQPFEATDSTPGRKVWTFQSQDVEVADNIKQTRETLLWDLAGQPGYRVIHQLHLNEVAVALVVFDGRSETDPLAGVRHWERALRLAQQRQGASCVPMKKFLVSARNDRGGVSVSEERLQALKSEFGFDDYFKTSAKEGWQIIKLRQAIEQAIPWGELPVVSSSKLFADIKAFLLKIKQTGRLVAPVSELYDDFARRYPKAVTEGQNLRDQFDTCIGRLENRDLIRRLSFGGYALLQPELLDAYASAMVNEAKDEPDGLGSIAEDTALAGGFFVPNEQKIKERGQEQLLLHATIEELARHDLALKESAADGRYLVFPSQFNRDYEDAPEPKGKAVAVTFEGPVQSLYSTLAVRLGHSGLFTTGRAEMWRNAAVFTAKAGGKCGLYLHEFEEAHGRLIIFYDQHDGQLPSDETRFNFEEFVLAHAERRALNDTVELVRFFVCANCSDPVPDSYVKRLRGRDLTTFDCPCGSAVSLAEPKERLSFPSKVEAMEKAADRERNIEMFIQSARGEMNTPSFMEWVGDDRATLAIIFTDVVGSTAIGESLKDARMSEMQEAHFAQSQKLIDQYKGREIKTIGDSVMAAFRSVEKALDYARALQTDPGPAKLKIRAGIHIGPMIVKQNDVSGGAVNFAARVVGAIKGAEIWLSDQAKTDLDSGGAKHHTQLKWQRHDGVEMKGFSGTFTLWSLKR